MKWLVTIGFSLTAIVFTALKIFTQDPGDPTAGAEVSVDVDRADSASLQHPVDEEIPAPEIESNPESEAVSPPHPLTEEKRQEMPRMQTAEEYSVEEKLQSTLIHDEKIKKVADITKVSCAEKTCMVEAEAKGETIDHFQMSFIDFLVANPNFGSKVNIKPNEDNPRLVTFTFIKE